MKLFQKILIGFVLGIILGAIWGPGIAWIKPVGTIFLSLLKMLIIPLIFSTLVVGVSSIAEPKKLGRVAGKTIAYYLITTAFAIIIGLLMGNILRPGAGMNLVLEGVAQEATKAPSLIDTLVNLIPTNPIGAMAQGTVLQVIVFALFFGYAMTRAGEKGTAVLKFFEGFAETMYKLTGIVMEFAPYGVFALIATTVGAHYFLPLLQKSIKVPILNMIEETAKESKKKIPQIKKVGLLASLGTYKTKIYPQHFEKFNIEIISPEKKEKDEIMRIIYAVKGGDLSKKIKENLLSIVKNLIERGAEAIIAGCTEIPLILKEKEISIPLIDPTQVLARVAIEKAR